MEAEQEEEEEEEEEGVVEELSLWKDYVPICIPLLLLNTQQHYFQMGSLSSKRNKENAIIRLHFKRAL